MIFDFNETRSPTYQAIIFSLKILLMVFVVSFVWEFGIEDSFFDFSSPETNLIHLEYVITIFAFTIIALIAPTITLARYIERRNLSESQIHHLATHDTLTSLPNRTLLFDRLNQAIARAQRDGIKFAVLYIDLDDFKLVNDQMGHDAGDFVLVSNARRLTHRLRETDTVARIGGDEFVAIVTDIKTDEQVRDLIEWIQNEVALPHQYNNKTFSVSASIGYALYSDQAIKADDLMCRADRAMYADKALRKDSALTPDSGIDTVQDGPISESQS